MIKLKDLMAKEPILIDSNGDYYIYELKEKSYIVKGKQVIHVYDSLKSIYNNKNENKTNKGRRKGL